MPICTWDNQHIFYQDSFDGETTEGDVLKIIVGIEPGEGALGILWNMEGSSETRGDLVRRLNLIRELLDKIADDRTADEAEEIRFIFIKYIGLLEQTINENWDVYQWR